MLVVQLNGEPHLGISSIMDHKNENGAPSFVWKCYAVNIMRWVQLNCLECLQLSCQLEVLRSNVREMNDIVRARVGIDCMILEQLKNDKLRSTRAPVR